MFTTSAQWRSAIAILLCLLGLLGIVMSAGPLLSAGNIGSLGTTAVIAPVRADLKERGISEQSIDAILRGGPEATNVFRGLNADQQRAIEDFQILYTSLTQSFVAAADAAKSKSRAFLLLSTILFFVGTFLWRHRAPAPAR